MRNPALFLFNCFLFVSLLSLPKLISGQSNPALRDVFVVTEGSKLFTKAEDIIHFKPSDYTGAPWNFPMSDLFDSSSTFLKSATFWVRHNFTSAPLSEVRIIRAASTISKAPVIASDAHFLVYLDYTGGNTYLKMRYLVTGTTIASQTVACTTALKPYVWYGVFVSKQSSTSDQGVLYLYDPSTPASATAYTGELQVSTTLAPAGYSPTPATSNFYIDIGGDTQIQSPSGCEIANFNFLYKKDYYTDLPSILELMKQPPRLLLRLEYKEIDPDSQLIMDYSNENNVAFRGESQFDINSDTTLNYYQKTNADVGHIYNQNGFDTIYPAFDLGREFAVSFWVQFTTKAATAPSDTNQIVFFKQNSQYPNMRIKVGFTTTANTVTGFILQCGNTLITPNFPGTTGTLSRTDNKWYYFYVYFANFRKNETTAATFHPTTLYNIRLMKPDGTLENTISGIMDDYFIHGGTTDTMRIGMGVDGQNEHLYGTLKKFQLYSGGWFFDIANPDKSLVAIGGAKTIHITKGVLSTRVFSQVCRGTNALTDVDCVATCPDGSYLIDTTVDVNFQHCESCYENCKSCTGRKETMCPSCFHGEWWPFGVKNCPDKNPCNVHQYDIGTNTDSNCQECMNECASCKDGTTCSACSGGYSYNLNNHQCEVTMCSDAVVVTEEQCDDGNLVDGDGCSSSCEIEQGFYCPQFGGACYSICGDNVRASNEQCDDGNNNNGDGCNYNCKVEDSYFCTPITTTTNIGPFFGASYKETCSTCTPLCKTCATASTCAVCASPNFLHGTTCVANCPTTSYYADTDTGTCKPCPALCNKCTSSTVCTECTLTNALLNNLCLDTCPDGKYNGLDSGLRKCLNCPAHCTTCSSATSCYTCETGYYLVTPGSSSGLCQKCDDTCYTCRGSNPTDCILCTGGRNLKVATSECVYLNCASNEYTNYAIGECQACASTCKTCSDTSATGCLSCYDSNGLTVSNKCLNCATTTGLYLEDSKCKDVCADGKRILKTTSCDDGNDKDGDGCSSDCVVESGWVCTGGNETSPDTCRRLYGPTPTITTNSRDPTSFLIGFDTKVINTLQESEFVTQINVILEGLDESQRLYNISWDATNQVFNITFDLKATAIDSLLTVEFRDPTRITDTFNNILAPYFREVMYPAYYYVDADTKKLASDLSTFSIVIQGINTATIIPLALTGYLNHYWLFLEFFQVVHDLSLINVRTPYLASKFFDSFRFMRMKWLPNALAISNLQYDHVQQLGTNKFDDQEINTYFLENNGYQLTTWVFLLVVWLGLKIVIMIGLKNTWLKQLIYTIMINLEWSIIIRAVIILFFDFCIYTFLQLTNLSSEGSAMKASSVLAIISTVFIGLFPVFCFFKTLKMKNQYLLTTDTKFDTLYREYKKRFKSTITFLSITLYQKAIIAAFLVGLQNNPEVQIGLLALEQIAMLVLLLWIRPYIDGSMNFRSVMQELILFAAIAMFYGLTKENTDEMVRDNVGKVIIGLIIVALLMHLLFLLKDSYLTIKNHYKRPSDQKQIFGKVRITPQSGPEEFQLNDQHDQNDLNLTSSERPIPRSQNILSGEDNSPHHHENTTLKEPTSPVTPTKESLFKY